MGSGQWPVASGQLGDGDAHSRNDSTHSMAGSIVADLPRHGHPERGCLHPTAGVKPFVYLAFDWLKDIE